MSHDQVNLLSDEHVILILHEQVNLISHEQANLIILSDIRQSGFLWIYHYDVMKSLVLWIPGMR